MAPPQTLRGKILYISTDIICFIIAALPNILMKYLAEPYERGFYCDDESLKKPYKGSTVRYKTCVSVGVLVPIVTIFLVELIHFLSARQHSRILPDYQIGRLNIESFLWTWYKQAGIFAFGLALSQTFNGIGKHTIGRLRPHFLTVCDPDYASLNCTNSDGLQLYITGDVCRGDAAKVIEARQSFPSGHSSFSCYCMLYLAIYLQNRMTWEGSKLCRHLLQGVALAAAYYTSLSRISDYKHHPTDVLSGAILGIVFAVVTAYCVSDLFSNNDGPIWHRSGSRIVPDIPGNENPLQIQLSTSKETASTIEEH